MVVSIQILHFCQSTECVCVCVWGIWLHMFLRTLVQGLGERQRTTCRCPFSPSTICVPGIKIMSSCLRQNAFTCWAVSLVHYFTLCFDFFSAWFWIERLAKKWKWTKNNRWSSSNISIVLHFIVQVLLSLMWWVYSYTMTSPIFVKLVILSQ